MAISLLTKSATNRLRILLVCAGCAIFFVLNVPKLGLHFSKHTIRPTPLDIGALMLKESTNFPCTNSKIMTMTFPVCTYTSSEDIYVSTWFLRGIYWEANYVTAILQFMEKYSNGDKNNLALVDIGTKVGAFSLAAAHAGYRVLSAEPSRETYKRLAKSVSLGKIADRMTVFPYIVSNSREDVIFRIDKENKGDNRVINYNATGSKQDSSNVVKSIILDDLISFISNKRVVLKIDAQGSETRILHPSSSTKFFTEIDVPLILLEWVYYHVNSQYPHKNTELLQVMLKHLRDMKFEPYILDGKPITNPDVRTYTEPDVIFKKRGYDFKI